MATSRVLGVWIVLVLISFMVFLACEKRGGLEQPQDPNAVRFTIVIQNQGVINWNGAMIRQFEQSGTRVLEFNERESIDDTTWTGSVVQRSLFSMRNQEPHFPVVFIEYWTLDSTVEQFGSLFVKGQVIRTRLSWPALISDQTQQEALGSYLNFGFPAGIFTFEDRKEVELRFSHGLPLGCVNTREWDAQGYQNTFFLNAGVELEIVDNLRIWYHVIDVWIAFEGLISQQKVNLNPTSR